MDASRILFVLITIALKANLNAAQCVWNLNADLPIKDPIYLKTGTNELLIPLATGLTLAPSQSMDLLCTGTSNTIAGTGLQRITATCTLNNKLMYNGVSYPLNAFECTSATSTDLQFSGQTCGNNLGEILKLGFKSSTGTANLIDVCYDRVNEASLYAVHTLYGKSLIGAEIESDRPSFRTTGTTYGTTTGNLYRQADQLNRFTTLLGSAQANKFINSTSFLARGHLAPDGDFLFGSWSFTSYFLVNAAPEWQAVNAGNWLKVEDMTRSVAIERQEDLTIYTGTHQVLSLPNANAVSVDMFLMNPDKLRVPKWYWKVIYSPATKAGIAIITLNNPHATSVSASEIFCPNICPQTGWFRPEFNTLSKGFTFCCQVSTLSSAVMTLPPLNVLSTLTGPLI